MEQGPRLAAVWESACRLFFQTSMRFCKIRRRGGGGKKGTSPFFLVESLFLWLAIMTGPPPQGVVKKCPDWDSATLSQRRTRLHEDFERLSDARCVVIAGGVRPTTIGRGGASVKFHINDTAATCQHIRHRVANYF